MSEKLPEKTIGRLIIYRRLLSDHWPKDQLLIHSYQLAALACVSSAQVRRDLMLVGPTGNPNRGYEVEKIIQSIGALIDAEEGQNIALVGLGNLGKAMISYMQGRSPMLKIVAAFDVDREKSGRMFDGVPCYRVSEIETVAKTMNVKLAVIAVPSAAAQSVATDLVNAGVRSIINFAPTPLRVPQSVYVENLDFTTAFEKAAFFASKNSKRTR